jgi:peptidoglycan/LPS O-acetylase OafA/YrhL
MTYQRELQGLRAVAVLAVVADHLDAQWLTGGFVGVDVFFVISGYLITGLLLAEHERTGRIALPTFYGRRVRRLLPAALMTTAATVAFGYLTLSTKRFELLVDSAVATVFSVSNIHFWSEVGYFDAEAATKPLLHTWSLGVEEQFYLVWPGLILLLLELRSTRSLVAGLSLVSVGSFALNAAFMSWGLNEVLGAESGFRSWLADGNATAFYWMPFRCFEFGIGALLTVWTRSRPLIERRWVGGLAFVGSFGAIIYMMVARDEHDVFPFYNALFVALASAVAIHSAPGSAVGRWLLANRLMVFIGGISYSLYLVHWPLIVYATLLGGRAGATDTRALCAAMLLFACALHYGVERPLRSAPFLLSPRPGWRGYPARASVFSAWACTAALIYPLKDIAERIPQRRIVPGGQQTVQSKYCSGEIPGYPAALFNCQIHRGAKDTLVVWGDSHAMHLVAGLSKLPLSSNIAIAHLGSCGPHDGFGDFADPSVSARDRLRCAKRNRGLLKWSRKYRGSVTLLLTSLRRYTPAQVAPISNDLVRQLRGHGHAAYVLGDFIGPRVDLKDCRAVPDFLISDALLARLCHPDPEKVRSQLRYQDEIAALTGRFIPVHRVQCPGGACTFVDDRGQLTHHDDHHLSETGSIYEIARVWPSIRAALWP